MDDEKKLPKIYEVGEVTLKSWINDAGGVEKIEGILYRNADDHSEAGVYTHSVGKHGESTGIFRNIEGTNIAEVAEVVKPKEVDLRIPKEYIENEKKYDELWNEKREQEQTREGKESR